MHLNPKYILREVAGETLLISLHDISAPKRIICLNELGKAIYFHLQDNRSKEDIISLLLDEYDIDEPTLRSDVDEFFSTLQQHNIILP